jgi:hypothetical protein
MKTEEFKIPVAAKLKPEQSRKLADTCIFGGVSQSTFIREAIMEKLENPNLTISNIAGVNAFEYDPKKDCFIWKVKVDQDGEKVIIKDISPEFLEQLQREILLKLKDRDNTLNRKNKKSVPVPRRLVR